MLLAVLLLPHLVPILPTYSALKILTSPNEHWLVPTTQTWAGQTTSWTDWDPELAAMVCTMPGALFSAWQTDPGIMLCLCFNLPLVTDLPSAEPVGLAA